MHSLQSSVIPMKVHYLNRFMLKRLHYLLQSSISGRQKDLVKKGHQNESRKKHTLTQIRITLAWNNNFLFVCPIIKRAGKCSKGSSSYREAENCYVMAMSAGYFVGKSLIKDSYCQYRIARAVTFSKPCFIEWINLFFSLFEFTLRSIVIHISNA